MFTLPGRLGGHVWLRQLADARRVGLVIASVVLIGGVFVASGPAVLEVAAVDDVRNTLSEASPDERNIRFADRREIGAGAPRVPFSNIEWTGGQLRDEHIPPSVLELVSDEQWIFDTPQFLVSTYPDGISARYPPTFRFRQQSDVDDHLTLVDGSLPTEREPEARLEGEECPEGVPEPDQFDPVEGEDCRVVALPVFETAITSVTADELGRALGSRIVDLGGRRVAVDGVPLTVGDRFMLRPDWTQLGFRTSHGDIGELRIIVEVSGLIELSPRSDEFWFGDVLLHRPRVRENNDFEFVFAAGLLGPSQYRSLRATAPGTGLDFSWRFLIDPELVEDTNSEELVADLQRIAPPDARVVTQLPDLLQDHLAQRRLTLQVWSMVAVAFVAAVVVAIATLARAEAVRRSSVDALQFARGASRVQLVVADALTAAAVVVAPTGVGVLIAIVVFPTADRSVSMVAAVGFASLGSAAFVLARFLRPPLPPLRQVLIRVALTGLALAVVLLLRRRQTRVSDAVDGDLDPTLMLAPLVLIAIVAVVGTDLLGPISRLSARPLRRSQGVVWFVGLRRVITNVGTMRGPLMAVVMATALSVVAVVLASSIESAQHAAARQHIGAEARIASTLPQIPLPRDLVEDIAVLDEEAVFGVSLSSQWFEGMRGQFAADLVALDGLSPPGLGGEPLEVELLGPWRGVRLPELGEPFVLELNGFVVPMVATSRSGQREGIRSGVSAVVVDRAAFAAATSAQQASPDFVLIDDQEVIDALVGAFDSRPAVVLSTRAAAFDQLADDPLSTWTRRGLRFVAASGVALAMVGSMAATAVHGRDRRRDLGLVVILGGTRRTSVQMACAELVPTFAGAAMLGVGGGVVAVQILGPSLSLEAFSDGTVSAGIDVAWGALALIVLGIAVALAAAVASAVHTIRRLDHAMMLRERNG
ncbi:MAG: hypothetical protein ACPHDT_02395 [Acidimicrobiales bacterium]